MSGETHRRLSLSWATVWGGVDCDRECRARRTEGFLCRGPRFGEVWIATENARFRVPAGFSVGSAAAERTARCLWTRPRRKGAGRERHGTPKHGKASCLRLGGATERSCWNPADATVSSATPVPSRFVVGNKDLQDLAHSRGEFGGFVRVRRRRAPRVRREVAGRDPTSAVRRLDKYERRPLVVAPTNGNDSPGAYDKRRPLGDDVGFDRNGTADGSGACHRKNVLRAVEDRHEEAALFTGWGVMHDRSRRKMAIRPGANPLSVFLERALEHDERVRCRMLVGLGLQAWRIADEIVLGAAERIPEKTAYADRSVGRRRRAGSGAAPGWRAGRRQPSGDPPRHRYGRPRSHGTCGLFWGSTPTPLWSTTEPWYLWALSRPATRGRS